MASVLVDGGEAGRAGTTVGTGASFSDPATTEADPDGTALDFVT